MEKKVEMVNSLAGSKDGSVKSLLAAWEGDQIFIHQADGNAPKIPVLLVGEKDAQGAQAAVRLDDEKPLLDGAGHPVRVTASDTETATHNSALRRAMKVVTDLVALSSPDRNERVAAINTFGMAQEAEKLPLLLAAQQTERDGRAKRALTEAIALIQLKDADPKVQIAAVESLGRLGSIPSRDFLTALGRESTGPEKAAIAQAAAEAQKRIAAHIQVVNIWGTAFRGISLGSVLLVAALGLAITFGLMGVINMAHGEIMVVGAYATYVVQCVFDTGLHLAPFGIAFSIPGMHLQGTAFGWYFIAALPVAFLSAAAVGLLLERGVIRFLYRRPLESLLATWAVSLILQQLFRMVFGANNVQVSSPAYLSGNWTVADVILSWNRVFVIGFAVVIVLGTHLVLTRTPLGLLIRAVMQNRQMAACMGVKTERVNMLTFGLGSGLAGLAGAFLSQLGNVGPSLGQGYIVDCFMTVVVGGVGNIAGTVISALGIGLTDQSLQQTLGNPVLGKILVLIGIILFLQWRPAGLFVTKSRSLES
ncbi:MAG: urea ABC transporter permease subunit UrtB [Burkholderiales bacterium]|nr:urea ABC transporter permease subunit UrtB [Opitutaceae bacterium]